MDARQDETVRDRAKTTSPVAGLRVVVLAVVAVLVLAGCASAGTRPAAAGTRSGNRASATVRHSFDPYDSAGALTVAVAHRSSGSCWSTSLADPTRWAFRCFSGNEILDPCFARPGTTTGTVACIADPRATATVLTLTEALPTTSYTEQRVWSFTRADGVLCVAATGTVPAVAGRNLDYNCADGTFASLDDLRARRVEAVFATIRSSRLSTTSVRDLWTS